MKLQSAYSRTLYESANFGKKEQIMVRQMLNIGLGLVIMMDMFWKRTYKRQ